MLPLRLSFVALVVAFAAFAPAPAHAAPVFYFAATGHSLGNGFADYVAAHGGLAVSGLPITEEIVEDGAVVQYFQNIRLEWRADRSLGKQVTAGPIGLELGKGQPPVSASELGRQGTYFSASGHTLADGFLDFYRAHWGSELLGVPITEELAEDGAVVQYFSNGALQWTTGGGVRFAALGQEAAVHRGWAAGAPPLAPVPAPPGARPGDVAFDAALPHAPLAGAPALLSIPVLMYHHIGSWPSPYSVSDANFAAQLDWLLGNGYHAVTLRQVYAALFGVATLPATPIVISVDDGYPDAATDARQALLARHMTATFFIPTVQTPLQPGTLRAMDSEGFDIEAHSRTHPDLTTLGDAAALAEIAGSKQDLERTLGHPVDLFAYPYGAVNDRIVSLLQRAGFRGGILAGGGRLYSPAAAYREPRILVDRGDDLTNFVAKVTGRPYKDTLNAGGVRATQPTPVYTSAPASVGASSLGTGGGTPGAPVPATNVPSGSGPSGGDPAAPTGRGQLII